jgi:UDP-glucuronate 4-epimerase
MGLATSPAPIVKRALVTGGAGFIGSHLVDALLLRGFQVAVLDNFDEFYDQKLKRENVLRHQENRQYQLYTGDIRDDQILSEVFRSAPFDAVVHLAALAGVRPSLLRPADYMDVNVRGTQKLLEFSKRSPGTRFIFASSSSVYGTRASEAFSEQDPVDKPQSPYAASKRAAELACYASHQCFHLDVMCLRFFTVYGPRQRPDLAINKFCRLIEAGEPIELYGDGSSKRDYTYVDDTVSGIMAALECSFSGFEIVNLGRGKPITLAEMVAALEKCLGKEAIKKHLPEQPGDVPHTHANIEKARRLLAYSPKVSLEEGVQRFLRWRREQEPLKTAAHS